MTVKDRQDGFLAKAQEAQDQADKAKDPSVRDSWLEIAESYRALARRQGGTDQN